MKYAQLINCKRHSMRIITKKTKVTGSKKRELEHEITQPRERQRKKREVTKKLIKSITDELKTNMARTEDNGMKTTEIGRNSKTKNLREKNFKRRKKSESVPGM
ncbi:hypothetical protein HHI36_018290 [Cryptolaemus montrouzieri]|uniref:Uncharacterized protein n=1 Tax=Cryptolaemus montrouzieri TaxID=559131 RepID=A0ABD2NZG0_9CUCU